VTPPDEIERPFPESMCWQCAHHKEVRTARSTFVLCTALAVKYPRQPMRTCSAFTERERDDREERR
jgi:hypothetical protein